MHPSPGKKKWNKMMLGGPASKCVGYCRLHKCNITADQMKKRECLHKECTALRKLPHPYWEQREKTKQKRLERKERLAAELAKYGH